MAGGKFGILPGVGGEDGVGRHAVAECLYHALRLERNVVLAFRFGHHAAPAPYTLLRLFEK
jgi:hypothetical protein